MDGDISVDAIGSWPIIPLTARKAACDTPLGLVSGGDGVSGSDGAGRFTGVKVFSATKAKEREELGDNVTRWLRSNADLEVVDRVVTQSSDNEFHCLTIVLFYREKGAS
jgi:hypothetical protein